MAKGRRNNRRGRGGGSQNTTNDSDANVSKTSSFVCSIAHDGSGDVLNHKGFSTGAFGTSDIDGSGLQSEVIIERSEMNHHEENNFRQEVHIPSRSRTSSIGGDSNEGFLNPNDFASGFGQNSQSSVRSRTSISNFEHRANRMSQLSIQTNQDEFVLVPGSGGHDGHASIRSMRSQVSRQSAKGAMSSRDDILTEGDETGGDELREQDARARLGSRASQLSRGSAFGGEVEIPMGEEASSGFRSRRQSENVNGEWENNTQSAQARRSHTSLDPTRITIRNASEDTVYCTISLPKGYGFVPPDAMEEEKKQIARLQTVQSMEEEKISITSKALAHARKKQDPHNELAAQSTILLARLSVTDLAIVRNPPPPVNKSVLGAMDISDITLHLNRNLCAKPSDGGSVSFGFIVVLKCGVEVEATAPFCLLVPQRPAGVKVVHFPEHLRFSNLPVDFTIRLEVYVMKLREPKEESCTALLALKARNLLTPGTRRAAITAGPGGSSGSGGSPCAINGELPIGELVRCGHTALDRDSVGSIRLYLDAPEYPLEGTIELASRCSRLPSAVVVDLRGFLTMYKVVGGYDSWVRYWAVLRRGIINFWKYPDDEQLDRGGPVASADLSKCTDGEIVPASREICTRQFAFSIDMLVATTPSIVEKKRVLLAADTRDQLKAWLGSLNETLTAIRA